MDADQAPQAFTQLLDRGIPIPVLLAEWCPTMDLLALLTTDGQLQLYRLNWQRLWSVTPESPISAVCWRPDGKQLAIGQLDGNVLLLNAEDGETQEQAAIFDSRVVSLTWTHSSLKTSPGHPMMEIGDRTRRLFQPPLPPLPPHTSPTPAGFESYEERMGKREEALWPPKLDVLGLVVCASAAGEVALCGEGLFLFAKFPCVREGTIQQLGMPSSLAEIAVRWQEESGKERLSLINTSLLAPSGAQHTLRLLCSYAADIARGVQTCRTLAWIMWQEWVNVKTSMDEFRNTLDDLLKMNGLEADTQSDLLLLVTMGEYTPPMEQFLMSSLGEAGLKKAARAVDAPLCAAHAVLVDRLQPEVEMVAFRLGELRGLAASPLNRNFLGLRCSDISFAERDALSLLIQLENFRDRLTVATAQYRTFFSWLNTALRRFPEDTVDTMMGYPLSHVDLVREFLHTEFASSAIEPLLSSPGLEDSADACAPETVEKAAMDPAALEESPDFDFWKDCVEQEITFGAWETGLLDGLFQAGKMAEKGARTMLKESASARAIGGDTPSEGTGILQTLRSLHILANALLEKPSAALSKALRDANPELLAAETGASSWVLAATSSSSLAVVAAANGASLSQASSQQGAGDHTNSTTILSSAFHSPGGLSYSDSGELTVVLPVEVESHTQSSSAAGIARMTVSAAPLPDPLSRYLSSSLFGSMTHPGHDVGRKENRKVEVAVTALPSGLSLVDAGIYKNGTVALLMQENTGTGSLLALVPTDVMDLRKVPVGALAAGATAQQAAGIADGEILDLGQCRQRILPHRNASARPPLAVSATRGIGFVLAGVRRAVLFDMEEDENDDEEERIEDDELEE